MANGKREFVPRDQAFIYLWFTVHYNYTKIGTEIHPNSIHKNCFQLFITHYSY